MSSEVGSVERDDWDKHWHAFSDASHANPSTRYRIRLIEHALSAALQSSDSRLLDLGSGTGELLTALCPKFPGVEARGVELSRAGVELARTHAPSALFLEADLLKQTTPPRGWAAWATAASCSEVLEHLDDPVAFLRSAIEMLAPGCIVAITVPAGPRSAFDKHIGHRRHFTRALLCETLTDAGLEVERVDAAGFPFFNLYKLLVIARGERLIQEAESGDAAESRLVRLISAVFRGLFRLNLPRTPWGWQLVAVARVPAGA